MTEQVDKGFRPGDLHGADRRGSPAGHRGPNARSPGQMPRRGHWSTVECCVVGVLLWPAMAGVGGVGRVGGWVSGGVVVVYWRRRAQARAPTIEQATAKPKAKSRPVAKGALMREGKKARPVRVACWAALRWPRTAAGTRVLTGLSPRKEANRAPMGGSAATRWRRRRARRGPRARQRGYGAGWRPARW